MTRKGQDNWNTRTGYQRVQRVPGPIEPMHPDKCGYSLLHGLWIVPMVLAGMVLVGVLL